MPQTYIGCDISKDRLDSFDPRSGAGAHANTASGIRALIKGCGPDSVLIFEATSGCDQALLKALAAARQPFVRLNPLHAWHFAQSLNLPKTDRVDARMLAAMGTALDLTPDQPVARDQRELKELQIARNALVKDSTRLKNRLKTQQLAFNRRQTKARLKQVQRQLKQLDGELNRRVRAAGHRARALDILRSIPGIGQVAAITILIECPEIGTLQRKQIASLAGLAPMTRQSGKWRGKAFIQGGRKFLRDSLYMPALVATRFNPDLAAKYNEMVNAGKPRKIALVATMRKLIELANALVKDNRKWQPAMD
jgi:transposase